MHHTKSLRSVAIVLGALLAAACSEAPTTAPAAVRRLTPSGAIPAGNVVQAKIATVTVCAEGPAGTYNYSLSYTGSTINTVVLPYGNSFSLTDSQCKDVLTIQQGSGFTWGDIDPLTAVTVTQTSSPANTQLDYLQKTQEDADQPACDPGNTFPCGIDTQESGPSTTIDLNFYHGSVISYWNEEVAHPVAGCTLTQGYWKNHTNWPTGYSPNALFFSSGKSWLTILGTPPKGGNAYIILAHQYIAATLNIASGASMPADVQAAYDAATKYFQTGVGSDPIGWSNTLDNYNNGLAAGGPNHCN